MSWSLNFSSNTKAEAHDRLRSEVSSNQFFPAAIAESIQAALDTVPDGMGVTIVTSGHVSTQGMTYNLSMYAILPEVKP